MSKFATGSVVGQETGLGIAGLNIDIEDMSRLHDGQILNKDPFVTDASGNFNLEYAPYAFNTTRPGAQARELRLTIRLGRHVLKEIFQNEGAFGDTIDFDKIEFASAEAESWLATLSTGKETRVSTGNAIRWLVDNVDAWQKTAQVIKSASTLDVMQLEIQVGDFKKDNPVVVLDFPTPPRPQLSGSTIVDKNDDRIEKSLLSIATKQPAPTDVRVQIPVMSLDPNILRDIGIAITPGAILLGLGAAGLFFIGGLVFSFLDPLLGIAVYTAGVAVAAVALVLAIAAYVVPNMPQYFADWYRKLFDIPELQKWFNDAATSGIDSSHVRVRQLKERSFNVTHAKLVMDRGKEAILLGSPLEQVYFDSPEHAIDAAWRGGSASKGPIHDVSVGVRGPALKDMQDLFNSHWKVAAPADPLPELQTPDPQTAGEAEFNSTVQIVLTLDQMFSGPGQNDGEKGVLEAYLRAIHFAKRFIYIENQYFHHPLVARALIDALTANADLVVILLLNICPDMPYYLRWQRKKIGLIVDELTKKYGQNAVQTRFRVFSCFSHAAPDGIHLKPHLIDNYLHTKTAIIDNVWATVGSANLDGASLDAQDYGKSLVKGEVRHTEANVLVYEATPTTPSAVDALRRQLWAEHLGILKGGQPGALDVQSADLDDSPTVNWLDFWSKKADAKLNGLKNDPSVVSPVHILPVDFDYGSDFDRSFVTRWFHALADSFLDHHYALASYLNHSSLNADDFDLSPPTNSPFSYGP